MALKGEKALLLLLTVFYLAARAETIMSLSCVTERDGHKNVWLVTCTATGQAFTCCQKKGGSSPSRMRFRKSAHSKGRYGSICKIKQGFRGVSIGHKIVSVNSLSESISSYLFKVSSKY